MKPEKTLVDFVLPPDFCSVPTVTGFKGRSGFVQIINHSKFALRVIITDATTQWRADKQIEKEKSERAQLAELIKKYGPRKKR
jgi:hypothetical protein